MYQIPYNNGRVVFGRGENTYSEVIDDFDNADFIGIITFNVSADPNNESFLLSRLKKACLTGTSAVLVTNIPKRFKNYYYDVNKEQAFKAIENYIDSLNPDKFNGKLSTFFCFENHAKIIMTNNIMYVGSANYSDESSSNWECGVIITDKNTIKKVRDDVFSEIINKSYPYFGKKIVSIAVELKKARDLCTEFKEKLFNAAFEPYSEYETNFDEKWVYKSNSSDVTSKLLSTFQEQLIKYEGALANLRGLLEDYEYADNPSDEIMELQECYDEYCKVYDDMLEKLNSAFEELEQLSHYDCTDESNRILDFDYGMESFDENLDYYMELAMKEAQSNYMELIENAEPVIRDILNDLKRMIKYFDQMAQRLRAVLAVRDRINNTGIIITRETKG